jgi:predicted anti-sigma-YlaC factor YlaD
MSHLPSMPHPPEGPLTCEQITAVLADYLLGEMDTATQMVFEGHLRDCQECLAFLRTYQQTVLGIRAVRYTELPVELLARIQQFLQMHMHRTPSSGETSSDQDTTH